MDIFPTSDLNNFSQSLMWFRHDHFLVCGSQQEQANILTILMPGSGLFPIYPSVCFRVTKNKRGCPHQTGPRAHKPRDQKIAIGWCWSEQAAGPAPPLPSCPGYVMPGQPRGQDRTGAGSDRGVAARRRPARLRSSSLHCTRLPPAAPAAPRGNRPAGNNNYKK